MKIKINFVNGAMLGLVGGLIGGAVWVIQHGCFPHPFVEHPILAIATHLFVAFIVGAILRFVPSGSFDETGIKTFNTLAWYKRVKWDEITSTKALNIGVMQYVLIYTADSKWAVWVPLNITNRKQLNVTMCNSGNDILKAYAKA